MSDVVVKPTLFQTASGEQSLVVTVVSGKEYRKLNKSAKKTNNPFEKGAQGTSVWQAMQNIVDKNGKRVFSESDIYKIDKQLKKQRKNVANGKVDVTSAVEKAGLAAKLEQFMKAEEPEEAVWIGDAMEQDPQIAEEFKDGSYTITVPAEPTGEEAIPYYNEDIVPTDNNVALTEEVQQVSDTVPEENAAAEQAEESDDHDPIADTKLFKVFEAAVITARNQDKFNTEDLTKTYDTNADGVVDVEEMADGIKAIQKDNKKGIRKDRFKGKEKADNTEDEKYAYDVLDNLGFYGWKSQKIRNTRAKQVENNQRDAAKAARSMLNSLSNEELNGYINEAKDVEAQIEEQQRQYEEEQAAARARAEEAERKAEETRKAEEARAKAEAEEKARLEAEAKAKEEAERKAAMDTALNRVKEMKKAVEKAQEEYDAEQAAAKQAETQTPPQEKQPVIPDKSTPIAQVMQEPPKKPEEEETLIISDEEMENASKIQPAQFNPKAEIPIKTPTATNFDATSYAMAPEITTTTKESDSTVEEPASTTEKPKGNIFAQWGKPFNFNLNIRNRSLDNHIVAQTRGATVPETNTTKPEATPPAQEVQTPAPAPAAAEPAEPAAATTETPAPQATDAPAAEQAAEPAPEPNVYADAKTLEEFSSIQYNPSELQKFAARVGKELNLNSKTTPEQAQETINKLLDVDYSKISKEELFDRYKQLKGMSAWICRNESELKETMINLNTKILPAFEENIRNFNIPQEEVDQMCKDVYQNIANGASQQVLTTSINKLITLAKVHNISFNAQRNPENDIDDSQNIAYFCADGINAIYQDLEDAIKAGDQTGIEVALNCLNEAKSAGYPISPNALTADEISKYYAPKIQQKQNQIIDMIKNNKEQFSSTEAFNEFANTIMKSPEFKELLQHQKAGRDIGITPSRDPNNDVVVNTALCPKEGNSREVYDAKFVNKQYEALSKALKEGNKTNARFALTALMRMNQAGFPISPYKLSDEEIAQYGSTYTNLADTNKSDPYTSKQFEGQYLYGVQSGSMKTRANHAGALQNAYNAATVKKGWFSKEADDPTARNFLHCIYAIHNKEQLDQINRTLQEFGGHNTDNPIAEMAEKLPAAAKKEIYRHLSYIDPYFKKQYEALYPNKK